MLNQSEKINYDKNFSLNSGPISLWVGMFILCPWDRDVFFDAFFVMISLLF